MFPLPKSTLSSLLILGFENSSQVSPKPSILSRQCLVHTWLLSKLLTHTVLWIHSSLSLCLWRWFRFIFRIFIKSLNPKWTDKKKKKKRLTDLLPIWCSLRLHWIFSSNMVVIVDFVLPSGQLMSVQLFQTNCFFYMHLLVWVVLFLSD